MQPPIRLALIAMLGIIIMTGATSAAEPETSAEEIRAAIRQAIPLIEAGSAGSAEHRTCFTCHSQAIPILALAAAKRRGFTIDDENFNRQVQHTVKHLERGRKAYQEGKGQGGRVVTAGYALWALESAGQQPNDLTAAVTNYLLTHQRKANHWSQASQRPPTSGSRFTNTYVALRALATFGTEQQQADIEARTEQVQPWLLQTKPSDTEDRVFRLRALMHVDVEDAAIEDAAAQLLATQRADGGWAQLDDMPSDVYATSTVLVALMQTTGLSDDHTAIGHGIRYLLDTQLADGSWHVVTRAKGFQTYFETGFPHGKDQFISTAASAWSVLALSLQLPEAKSN